MFQDPSVTQVTEPEPSSQQEEYNPFAEGEKPKKDEPQVSKLLRVSHMKGGRGLGRKCTYIHAQYIHMHGLWFLKKAIIIYCVLAVHHVVQLP